MVRALRTMVARPVRVAVPAVDHEDDYAGDRDKELRYRKRAEAMIEEFGPNAQREIDFGRREQMKRMR
jgi:hypothetical protein